VKVVVDDGRRDGGSGKEENLGSGHSQQHEHAEHALFVVLDSRNSGKHLSIHGKARDHDHRAGLQRVREDLFVLGSEAFLKPLEALGLGC